MARSDGNRERLQQLGEDGVGSLTKMIEEVTDQRNQLERELNDARTSLSSVQNQLDLLQVRASAMYENQTAPSALAQTNNPEVFLGMVQELRTPLTSIVGYIDLLLDESAGILGEMQRKFLQRVAANVTRLTFMLEDLTRVTALDNSRFTLMPEPVDVVGLIEDAISNSTYEFREKDLTVHLHLDDNVPSIRSDRDAISQIISELLTNAYLASPPNSPIIVTAHRQQVQLSQNNNLTTPTDCLLISVEDRGGGIQPEDIPRVFARKYKADNPLIEGLGDTGVGLSIAKTLVEAHGGGLWVETRENLGSIFYFALPIETSLETEGQ
jgi:signal transduction histidine kinase